MSRPVFRKYASFAQLQVETLEDMERLETLDEARWTATSVPIDQLVADPAMLAYIDTDGNGRIRVNELKEARRWLWARLRNRERVVPGSDVLLLEDLDPTHEDTGRVKDLAGLLLEQLGAVARDRIELSQARAFKSVYMARFPNGDGVVPPQHVADETTRSLCEDVLRLCEGGQDLSGVRGVRGEDIDLFLVRIAHHRAWRERRVLEADRLFPLGPETEAAAAVVVALAPKLDQYFAQCALVALESGANHRLQASEAELAKLDVSDPAAIRRWLDAAPIARPDATGVLHLDGPINPNFAERVRTLARDLGPRALGREGALTRLDAVEWSAIQRAFDPFTRWMAERNPGIPADADADALERWLDHPAVGALRGLVAEDLGVADELRAFNTLERLLLYQSWLLLLINNIVSMPDLFHPSRRTLFQRGTLILDGRRIQLCVKVTDIAAHKVMAKTSLIYLCYVRLNRREGDQELTELIAAAVTADIRGGIALDKRGVFYDREGREWDAVVVDLIEHPISVREAMIEPFIRLRDQVASRLTRSLESAASDTESKAGVAVSASPVGGAKAAAPPGQAQPSGLQSLLVGGSVALAAVGSSAAFMVKTVAEINLLNAALTLLALAAWLAGLFGLLAWLKLRRRDISALLEACGWALNSRMRLVHALAHMFTQRPSVPAGAIVHRPIGGGGSALITLLLIGLLAGSAWLMMVHPEWVLGEKPVIPEPIPEVPAAP